MRRTQPSSGTAGVMEAPNSRQRAPGHPRRGTRHACQARPSAAARAGAGASEQAQPQHPHVAGGVRWVQVRGRLDVHDVCAAGGAAARQQAGQVVAACWRRARRPGLQSAACGTLQAAGLAAGWDVERAGKALAAAVYTSGRLHSPFVHLRSCSMQHGRQHCSAGPVTACPVCWCQNRASPKAAHIRMCTLHPSRAACLHSVQMHKHSDATPDLVWRTAHARAEPG